MKKYNKFIRELVSREFLKGGALSIGRLIEERAETIRFDALDRPIVKPLKMVYSTVQTFKIILEDVKETNHTLLVANPTALAFYANDRLKKCRHI